MRQKSVILSTGSFLDLLDSGAIRGIEVRSEIDREIDSEIDPEIDPEIDSKLVLGNNMKVFVCSSTSCVG